MILVFRVRVRGEPHGLPVWPGLYPQPLCRTSSELASLTIQFAHDTDSLCTMLREFETVTVSVAACHALFTNSIPERFPKLRFGFIEASAQWIPYMIHDPHRLETRGRELPPEPLKANRIWVTCQTDDDLPYVLKYAGEDNIVVGTDYGHQDQSSEIEAMRLMREKGDVDPRVIDKILGDNAVALYGL